MLLRYTDTKQPNTPILVFIHGWPDTGALWKEQIAYFAREYRCVTVTLPAFDLDDPSSGVDFPELADGLIATIKHIKGDSNQPVILIGHDWGAYLTYLVDQRAPHLADRLVTMDVGAHFSAKNFAHAFFMVSYQWWLVLAWAMAKVAPWVGNAMSRWFSKIARAPRGKQISAKMNYPYFYFWRARLFKKYRAALPVKYRPQKPLLYLYGLKKKYHFHSPKWEKTVAETPGSKVVGLPNGDHWLMVRDPAATNAAIDNWLKSAPSLAGQ